MAYNYSFSSRLAAATQMATPVVTPIHPEDEAALLGKQPVENALAELERTPYRLTSQDVFEHIVVCFKRCDAHINMHDLLC